MDSRVTFNGKTRRPACLVGVPYGDNNYSESTLILSGERLILLLLCSVSFSAVSWTDRYELGAFERRVLFRVHRTPPRGRGYPNSSGFNR